MHHDDDLKAFLAKLRPGQALVTLDCPDCQAKVTGKGGNHARALLAIHQEDTCQGAREVSSDDGDSDPPPDPPDPADVPRVMPPE